MKKFISLLLALVLACTIATPAFAAAYSAEELNVPIVTIRGDGTDIYDASGENIVWPVSLGDEEGDSEILKDSVIEVLSKLLVDAALFGDWDAYYDAFYEAVLPLFDEAQLDGDGNPKDGTQMDPKEQARNAYDLNYNKKGWTTPGRFTSGDYTFHYDWRLSPLETAEKFDAYIQGVMKATGAKQVNIHAICLGGCTLNAYLALYLKKLENGTKPYIKNVFFDCVVSNDCDVFTEAFCGDVSVDVNGLQRFLDEEVDPDDMLFDGAGDFAPFINKILFSSYELLKEIGMADKIINLIDGFYQIIYEGLVPKLAIASYGTLAGYWASVDPDRYIEARDFVFGKEGSEMYEQYKGLIAKLDKYHYEVATQKDKIYDECEANGVHFGVMAKYGFNNWPFTPAQNELSDKQITLESASFGATCALIGDTLPEDYIKAQEEAGLGKYISNDKAVDLSTARFKDSTWIIKNSWHEEWAVEDPLINRFMWGTNETVDTINEEPYQYANFSQYMVYTNFDKDFEEREHSESEILPFLEPMTDENCNIDIWDEIDVTKKESNLFTKLTALFKWLTVMVEVFMKFVFKK